MRIKNSSRREFIKTGLFMGASTLLPGGLALTNIVHGKNSDEKRIIVIGAG